MNAAQAHPADDSDTREQSPDPGAPRGIDRRHLLGAAVAGAVGLTAAACTPSGAPKNTAGHPAAGATHTPAKPAVVAERDLPGAPDWRLTNAGPADAIVGYADRSSALPGEPVGLRVSTAAASFTVSAYRVGWYGGDQARLVWRSGEIPGAVQSPALFDTATRTVRTEWTTSTTLDTTGWPEGAYLLRLDCADGHQRYVPLILRSAAGAGKVVIMHAPATWQAYNLWGGYSLYQGENGSYETRSYVVSFDRPYDDVGALKFLVYERAAVVLAERLGLDLAYTTGIDVHDDPSVLTGATALFCLGHDEYWTPEQRASVTAARDAGTNLAFLGANTCFRRIRFDTAAAVPNRSVVCYKTAYALDPLYGHQQALVTNDYREPPAADPESSMTGVLYEGYPVDAPYVVLDPGHWLYAGTGVTAGESFAHLVGVEYDRVTPGAPTPRPIAITAHSPLVCEGRASHSDTAYYTVPSGAGVFASGTMRWVEGLMAGTRDDGGDHGMDSRTRAFVTQTTQNLMLAFAAGPAGRTRPAQDNLQAVYGTAVGPVTAPTGQSE